MLSEMQQTFKRQPHKMVKHTQTILRQVCLAILIDPLQAGVAFLYPLKTSENLKVF